MNNNLDPERFDGESLDSYIERISLGEVQQAEKDKRYYEDQQAELQRRLELANDLLVRWTPSPTRLSRKKRKKAFGILLGIPSNTSWMGY